MARQTQTEANRPLEKFFTATRVSAQDPITERMYQGFDEHLFEGALRAKVWKTDPNMSFGELFHDVLGKPDAAALRKIAVNIIAAKKSLPPNIDFKFPMTQQKLWEKLTDMLQSPVKISKPRDYVQFIQLGFYLTSAARPVPSSPLVPGC